MSHTRTAVIILIIQATLTNAAKNTARPVHEVVNEQARVDEKRPFLYTNPLAITSNAKLHAQHQQAMFNAERIRQHRAQSQRWMQHPQTDSYMRAYQESQENHQLALEKMQSNPSKRPKTRQKTLQAKEKEIQIPELTKITRDDALVNENNRNHRSYGSVYHSTQNKRKINILPGIYDQGVTIKPNGNVGLNHLDDESRLYAEVVPKTQYVYPKLYSQMHAYQSAEDIQALNYLLSKPADEQLTELNALYNKDTILDKPMDIYFYSKDPVVKQIYSAPQNVYISDEKPITEEIDDIEDPHKFTRLKTYGIQGVLTPETSTETSTKQNNYYKIEVEENISENKPKDMQYAAQYAVVQDKPSFQALTYQKPVAYYPKQENGKYLHHETTGVHHLSQDGTGVSAYEDDDVSKINLRKKRDLDTNPFILGNESISSKEILTKLDVTPFSKTNNNISELNIHKNLSKDNINDTNIYLLNNTTLEHLEIDINETLPKPEELKRYISNPDPDYVYDSYNDFEDDDYEPNKLPHDPDGPDYELIPNHKPSYSSPDTVTNNHNSFSSRYSSYKRPNYYGLEEFEPHSWVADIEPVYMLTASQLKSLIGHHNLNIQHLDLYQLPKPKRPRRYPRYRRFRKGPKHLRKLKKLNKFVRF